MKLTSI